MRPRKVWENISLLLTKDLQRDFYRSIWPLAYNPRGLFWKRPRITNMLGDTILTQMISQSQLHPGKEQKMVSNARKMQMKGIPMKRIDCRELKKFHNAAVL